MASNVWGWHSTFGGGIECLSYKFHIKFYEVHIRSTLPNESSGSASLLNFLNTDGLNEKIGCTRLISQHSDLRDVIVKSNASGIALDQEKVDQYIKAMSLTGSEKENSEKLAAMWMYATQMGSLPPPSVRKITPPSRPIMLIPARAASTGMLAPPPHPIVMPPPMVYRGMPMPHMRPGSLAYAGYHPSTGSIPGSYRTHKSSRSAGGGMQNQRPKRSRQAAEIRSGKIDASKRQRSKSDADMLDGHAFQYTGLDRTIADSFLAQQAQSNTGSQIDYSSSSSASDTYGKGKRPSPSTRASSKTKIICRDVVM